jgi:hypothetical protein
VKHVRIIATACWGCKRTHPLAAVLLDELLGVPVVRLFEVPGVDGDGKDCQMASVSSTLFDSGPDSLVGVAM